VEAVVPNLAYAPWPRRIASALIDLVVFSAISLPFLAPTLSRALEAQPNATKATFTAGEIRVITVVTIVVQVTYMTAMHAWRGSTVGKMAMRTVVVRDDGSKVTPAVAFIRAVSVVGVNFVSGFLIAPVFVDNLRPLWNPHRQTFHDQIARTVVVMAKSAPTGYYET
jgi:uncharacterized RDD family membrane protein YckC